MRSIPARYHTFVEIDHEIISTTWVVVSYKQTYVHEVLVNCLVKLAQEKSVVRWTDHPNMTIAVDWEVKNQTNQAHLSMTAERLGIVVGLPLLSIVCKLFL